jgi:hypothetical protein
MEIKLPHNYEPRFYQLPLLKALDSGVRRAVCIWHRRSGKDTTSLNFTIKRAFEQKGTYYHIFPSYNQGRKVIWDGINKEGFRFIDYFPKELVKSRNEQEMRIELVNGSAWQIVGSDNIDRIVGTNPIGVVFSEFALQKPQAWEYIRPILAENNGWAIFLFTPRGLNHGWKILQQAKESNWFYEILTVDDTKAIDEKILEEEKKQMPIDLFEQEYYCKFVEGASQFFRRVNENIWDGNMVAEENKRYILGVDIAKYADWTVITPFDLHTFRAGMPERFQKVDYPMIKARIEAACYRFNKALIRIDSTGAGEPVYDDLIERGLPVEPYKFTDKSRMDLLRNLAILLEQDKIKIPNFEPLINELKSFQWKLSEAGRLRAEVPEGLHDDCVMSLALSVWNLPSQPLKIEAENVWLPQFQEY